MISSTSFQRSRLHLTSAELRNIEGVLQRWSRYSIGLNVAPNIRDREHFLTGRVLARLLRVLDEYQAAEISVLQAAYQAKCHSLQRKGKPVVIGSAAAAVFGHAVDLRKFRSHLLTRFSSLFPTMTDVDDLIARLQTNPKLLSKSEKQVFAQEFNSWVTWNEMDPSLDPFGFLNHRIAEEIRGALGLDDRLRGPILLLRYSLPEKYKVHRPTVADAGLSKYFSPPILTEDRHGFTRPWDRILIQVGGKEIRLELDPCPEGVHDPIRLELVATAIEELP